MDEYPDPDEEFELMYGDDLQAMREQERKYLKFFVLCFSSKVLHQAIVRLVLLFH